MNTLVSSAHSLSPSELGLPLRYLIYVGSRNMIRCSRFDTRQVLTLLFFVVCRFASQGIHVATAASDATAFQTSECAWKRAAEVLWFLAGD